MNICIIGWYGTETLGDRAILDGIFIELFKVLKNGYTCYLGSLEPDFTERTLYLDKHIYESHGNIQIEVFDLRDSKTAKKYIKKSNLLIMGGGPLMEIREIDIIDECFRFANRNNIKAMVMGCGYGPVHTEKTRKKIGSILKHSNMIAWRDSISKNIAENIYGQNGMLVRSDPAIISAKEYNANCKTPKDKNDLIACNLREYTHEYASEYAVSEDELVGFISNYFSGEKMLLVPMHSYWMGGDDRMFFSKINYYCKGKFGVIYRPQDLYELYETFKNAKGCIGMRYHAVVLQTILNANNIILDYTNKKNGKIIGFLQEYSLVERYSNRYCNLMCDVTVDWDLLKMSLEKEDAFAFNMDLVNGYKKELEYILDC